MSKEQDALKALNEIEIIVQQADIKLLSPKDLCKQYKKIKKYIKIALWLIERIPVYGKKIGLVIRYLMKIAERSCA